MDIKRVAIDAVNETIVMNVVHMDYKGQVAKRINEKLPLAQVKGFRKGQVPKDLVEKQYGKGIKQEEVKKVVDLALERYIQSERLNLLGTPLPKVNENLDWDAEELTFEFEIGLVPNFEIDLEAKNNIVKYIVTADDKLIDGQVERIQKQFGKAIPQDKVEADSDLTGTFTNEEKGINNTTTISVSTFNKEAGDKFIGKKVGDVVTVSTKGLFEDDHQLMDYLKVSHDDVHGLDIEVNFTIEAINGSELAELNQELFDKLFGEGKVASLEDLKAKIKEDAEAQFAQQADQKLLLDVQDFLIENTKFDLPAEFLKKWLQTVGEKKLSAEEAEVEYARSEKGLRFQLIEGKAMAQSNIQITFEDLKEFTSNAIRQQMAQFGQTNPTEEEVQGIVARVLSNQEEVKRLSEQVVAAKLLDLFKEKANPTTKEVTYEEFIAASYGE
ncbi:MULTISPECIES: trigger factor [unclassified Flavobacterium]|uniref:trigger factor n=1 Tax=unclassified Flavobacterium TaxID=196869 RepID=UPI00070AFB59|nr:MULTISPECIES: trigger factor [unclassified Flavobacterium]KRD59835.1 peptidylprolyl isomerase [Flavobacterium sp. Root935]MDQ1164250.1 trigger factor [Flavobacterium sp. SORGH_AS_0622]TDX14160.1 trigger factor [Flavobacterium sp. S87F.05.LMB.W.Kidney.N]BDU24798.1 peptidylprolyl isomerase [Flavobacterium sp. GSB-24]